MWLGANGNDGGDGGERKEDERMSTVIRLMCDSNSTLPSKKVFDINTHKPDNKIKICIIL